MGLAPLVTRDVFERIALINTELGTTVLVVEQNANLALDITHPGVRAGDRRHRGLRHRRRRAPSNDVVRRAYLGV